MHTQSVKMQYMDRCQVRRGRGRPLNARIVRGRNGKLGSMLTDVSVLWTISWAIDAASTGRLAALDKHRCEPHPRSQCLIQVTATSTVVLQARACRPPRTLNASGSATRPPTQKWGCFYCGIVSAHTVQELVSFAFVCVTNKEWKKV